MYNSKQHERTKAQESSNAIEKIYIAMRHLFNRGFYKPMGVSGETLRKSLLLLSPEIYGSIGDSKIELQGLLYVIDRLPEGIEECTFINLTSDEGYADSHFKSIIPKKRRRHCYRIDHEQMNIEITRGRSEIYDILTHLTFLFIESHKIYKNILINEEGSLTRDWLKLEKAATIQKKLSLHEREIAISHTANVLGRTFSEITAVYSLFATEKQPERFLHIIYWLGKLAIEELRKDKKRLITFSPVLRERIGHHIHGGIWANNIKEFLSKKKLLHRPIHIISANMHSVMNTLFSPKALKSEYSENNNFYVYGLLSDKKNTSLRGKVTQEALKQGMLYIDDTSGANIDVQVFDTSLIDVKTLDIVVDETILKDKKPIILVMDYAFGEQAYETIDELLKPFKSLNEEIYLDVVSLSIMGKAGILEGNKGDIMLPSAHILEGTSGNYPFINELELDHFREDDIGVYKGSMVTVLGTSLQNKDVLRFFHNSTWNVIGLEMEGAHYQKAIQAASKVRGSITKDVKVRYAYYASDNPLKTGATLASGGLGNSGVKPTYVITRKILEQILN